ncbi:MAG: hypothetical protein HC837_06685 [Chloroflexaceae bacterium]|nr:hypothetical protein [Chloroflexaceae bacterium]
MPLPVHASHQAIKGRVVSSAQQLLTSAALLYAMGMVILSWLWQRHPKCLLSPWVEASSLFAPYTFLPVLPLCLVAIVRRWWLLRLTVVLLLGLFGSWFGPFFWTGSTHKSVSVGVPIGYSSLLAGCPGWRSEGASLGLA